MSIGAFNNINGNLLTYTVRRGNTLSSILRAAQKTYPLLPGQTVRVIASQSGIKNPNLILPGQTITIYLEPPPRPECRLVSLTEVACPPIEVAAADPPPHDDPPKTADDPLADFPAIADASLPSSLIRALVMQMLKDLAAGRAIDKKLLLKLLEKLAEIDPSLGELVAKLKDLLQNGGSDSAIREAAGALLGKIGAQFSLKETAEKILGLPEAEQQKLKVLISPSSQLGKALYLCARLSELKRREEAMISLLANKSFSQGKIADVNLSLGQNLTEQGGILEELGADGTDSFNKADKYFAKALEWADKVNKEHPSAPWPLQIKARIFLLQAKTILLLAGKEKTDPKKKKELLKKGLDLIEKAAGLGQLKFAELSLVFQTWGDLLSAQKKFGEAIEKYDQAIATNPLNYDAQVGRADALNWKKDYAKAIEIYNQVLEIKDLPPPLLLRARLGLAEARLRSKNFGKEGENVIEAEKAVLAILTKSLPGSFLIPRAKQFTPEIITAYLKLGMEDQIETLLTFMDGDSFFDDAEKLVLHALVAQIYDGKYQLDLLRDNDEAGKLHAEKAHRHAAVVVDKYPRLDPTKLTNKQTLKVKLALADAHLIRKEYQAALDIYLPLLDDPKTPSLEQFQIMQKCGEIYSYNWEGRNFSYAESYFKTVFLQYYTDAEAKKLDQKEMLLFTKALFGMGEMKRFGSKQDGSLSLYYYKRALTTLTATEREKETEDEGIEFKQMRTKIFFGLAKAYDRQGDRVAAQKAILEAERSKEAIVDKTARAAIDRAKVAMADPLARVTHQHVRDDKGRTEEQEVVQARVPITDHLEVGVDAQVDRGPGLTILTLYSRLRLHDISLGADTYLSLDTAVKIPGRAYYTDPAGTIRFFRQPDILSTLSLSSRPLSFTLATSHYYEGSGMTVWDPLGLASLYTNIMFNFSSVFDSPWLSGLQLGLEANWFRFFSGGQSRERALFSPVIRYALDFESLGVPDWLKIAKLRLFARWLSIELVPGAEFSPATAGQKYVPAFDPLRGSVGIGLDVNFGQWGIPLIFSADYEYMRQFSHRLPTGLERDVEFQRWQLMLNLNLPEAYDRVKRFFGGGD